MAITPFKALLKEKYNIPEERFTSREGLIQEMLTIDTDAADFLRRNRDIVEKNRSQTGRVCIEEFIASSVQLPDGLDERGIRDLAVDHYRNQGFDLYENDGETAALNRGDEGFTIHLTLNRATEGTDLVYDLIRERKSW